MTDYMQHYYADEPECVWCGHYGPVDDPDEPCARRLDVARAVWKLRKSERALREQLKALLGAANADKSTEENSERIYPCARCGVMRSKAEGGTVFAVCDDCWDLSHPDRANADRSQSYPGMPKEHGQPARVATYDGVGRQDGTAPEAGSSSASNATKQVRVLPQGPFAGMLKSQSSKLGEALQCSPAKAEDGRSDSAEVMSRASPIQSTPPRPDARSGLSDCDHLGGPDDPVTAGENPAGGVNPAIYSVPAIPIDAHDEALVDGLMRKRVSLKINSVKRMEFEPSPEDYQDQLRNEARQADARPYAFPDGSPELVKPEPPECEECGGAGSFAWDQFDPVRGHDTAEEACHTCSGTGKRAEKEHSK